MGQKSRKNRPSARKGADCDSETTSTAAGTNDCSHTHTHTKDTCESLSHYIYELSGTTVSKAKRYIPLIHAAMQQQNAYPHVLDYVETLSDGVLKIVPKLSGEDVNMALDILSCVVLALGRDSMPASSFRWVVGVLINMMKKGRTHTHKGAAAKALGVIVSINACVDDDTTLEVQNTFIEVYEHMNLQKINTVELYGFTEGWGSLVSMFCERFFFQQKETLECFEQFCEDMCVCINVSHTHMQCLIPLNVCVGTLFQLKWRREENTNLPVDTKHRAIIEMYEDLLSTSGGRSFEGFKKIDKKVLVAHTKLAYAVVRNEDCDFGEYKFADDSKDVFTFNTWSEKARYDIFKSYLKSSTNYHITDGSLLDCIRPASKYSNFSNRRCAPQDVKTRCRALNKARSEKQQRMTDESHGYAD